MSAPAPALTKSTRRIVAVRMSDAAVIVGYLSLTFGLLLLLFPVSFPRLIVNSWQHGDLIWAMMLLTLALDAYLYLRIAFMVSARPSLLAALCLWSLPIVLVEGLSYLLQSAVARTLAEDLPNLQARIGEEVVAHTYLGIVSAVFLPFLVVRLLQQFKTGSPSHETVSGS